MRGRAGWFLVAMVAGSAPAVALAHGFEPALLTLAEDAPGRFHASLRAKGEDGEALVPVFPASCTEADVAEARAASGHRERTSRLECPRGLRGETVAVKGLEGGRIDVLLRVSWVDGQVDTTSLRRGEDAAVVGRAEHGLSAYVWAGARHVLSGADHLLFVLCLLLISRKTRELAVALTAFTAAHSVTLSLAALDLVHVPAAPVEACIALSVAFLARTILRPRPDKHGLGLWAVAFAAGLLHGMGLAGGLSELGLPARGVASALLGFNLGVEAGQLGFLAAALLLVRLAGRRIEGLPTKVSAYAAGVVAMTWALQRVAAFWSPVW